MNKKNNKIFLFLLSAVLSLLFLTLTSVDNLINKNLEYTLKSISGESEADTNIVLITIEDSDIQQLGGWPLKRSYYALLIDKLNQMNVNGIGIEIFLSNLISSQSVYSDVLLEQVKETDNLVFGSIINHIKHLDNNYQTDTINFPFVKKIKNVKTGHLSYLTINSRIVLPVQIRKDSISEYSFSFRLAKIFNEKISNKKQLTINFDKSWTRYKKYSFLEFFNLFENDKTSLKELNNKIILVGITAQSLAKNLSSFYDDELPGIGFHALALDNILNENFYNDSYFGISSVVLFLLAFLQILISKKKFLSSLIIFLLFGVIAFVLLNNLNIYLDYSAFIFPFILNSVLLVFLFIITKNETNENVIKEKDLIHEELSVKTMQLKKLENELELGTKNSSNGLLEKVSQLKQEVIDLRNRSRDSEVVESIVDNEVFNFNGIIYSSKEMKEVVSTIKKVAKESATILILGESGSGKELIAKAIHKMSDRNKNNFVAVNCAALSESLLESELFGYLKGAFTNAVTDKKGLFEEADNGTIFLDEIGETSEIFQTKLLRVLQSGEIQKVGSTKTISVDTRIIAATNKDLKALVEAKQFREDLYYRLNVIQIKLPPLRDRKEDIKLIVDYFLKREDNSFLISKAVLDILTENEWRGNVRELESVIKRAIIYAKSEERNIIQIKDLPNELSIIKKENLEDTIIDSLATKNFSHSSINETAAELSISRTSVSENLRGFLFKRYVNSSFDIDLAILLISKEPEVVEKLKSKLETYLSNIKKDIEKLEHSDFDFVKKQFVSKYKNLPSKYHLYLDEILKKLCKTSEN